MDKEAFAIGFQAGLEDSFEKEAGIKDIARKAIKAIKGKQKISWKESRIKEGKIYKRLKQSGWTPKAATVAARAQINKQYVVV